MKLFLDGAAAIVRKWAWAKEVRKYQLLLSVICRRDYST